MHTLQIKIRDDCPNRNDVVQYYSDKINTIGHVGDSGIDLIFPDTYELECNTVTKIGLGISAQFIPAPTSNLNGSYLLYPRSSIVNTPLMLANSIGLIDQGYRGEIIAAFRCYVDRNVESTITDLKYTVNFGQRLVQIVSPDLCPIQIQVVDSLTDTSRGEGGFGSTN